MTGAGFRLDAAVVLGTTTDVAQRPRTRRITSSRFSMRFSLACCVSSKEASERLILFIRKDKVHDTVPRTGANYFDERRRQFTVDRLTRRIEHLGYRVHLEPLSTIAAREIFMATVQSPWTS